MLPGRMTGTLINVGTVLAGSAVGGIIGARLPERVQQRVLAGLGLVTLVLGVDNALAWRDTNVLYVLLGGIAGEALRIEDRLQGLGVALSAVSVLVVQGAITLAAGLFEDILVGEPLAALTSAAASSSSVSR